MKFLSSFTLFAIILIGLSSHATAQDNLLGTIDFPNSGEAAAQKDFIEGMKFLHNFEYADAARSFQRARDIDPDFVMAHYGEAKSHNHPIWFQQDRNAAMDVLRNLGETVEERQDKATTQREKDLLMSLEVLYGNTSRAEGATKEERDDMYMEYMAELHQKYPDDHEITAFYGLSILGSAHEGRDYGIYMKAAAELFDVWNENPDHPGAAHYLIHSFDDPIHAPLGLPMAKAYSRIAPSASHAQHMTSHIFLALGMWEETIEANIVARDVQQSRQQELDEEPTVCGHYTWWLEYGYLQTGEFAEAEKVLNTCMDRVEGSPSGSELWHFSMMRGHYVVDTGNWEAANTWMVEDGVAQLNYLFTSAYAAVQRSDFEQARQNLGAILGLPESTERDIQADQIKSLLLVAEGREGDGISLLRKAVEAESALPVDFGPPTIVKPSYELLGDVLLELGEHQEAYNAYEQQLARTPDRRRSLIGRDRASGHLSSN